MRKFVILLTNKTNSRLFPIPFVEEGDAPQHKRLTVMKVVSEYYDLLPDFNMSTIKVGGTYYVTIDVEHFPVKREIEWQDASTSQYKRYLSRKDGAYRRLNIIVYSSDRQWVRVLKTECELADTCIERAKKLYKDSMGVELDSTDFNWLGTFKWSNTAREYFYAVYSNETRLDDGWINVEENSIWGYRPKDFHKHDEWAVPYFINCHSK